jgi:membrane-bound lytic murein transglycosylase D
LSKASLLITALLLTSCSSFVSRNDISKKTNDNSVQQPKERIVYKEVIRYKNSPKTYDHVAHNTTLDHIHDLELDYKQHHFDFWVKYFSKREKARFLRHSKNGAKYRRVIDKILKSHGLPQELFFVGLIESGYNMKIRSHASAVGPWQFIKGTAKRYGLRVDGYVDERSHIIKATEAAASYFKDLYNIFGSWELALCAYNAGEYRIINAIRKGNTRSYKELVKKKLIPKETIYYVPKVAAARAIFENPNKYGLVLPKEKVSAFEKVKPYKVKRSFDLRKVAKRLGLPLSTLQALNPDLKRRWVKVTRRSKQSLFIPSSKTTDYTLLANTEKRRLSTKTYASKSKRKSSKKKYYKVRKGDNLYKISKRLNISMSTLKRLNRIRGSKIYIGQKLKVRKPANSKISKYRVRKGDNLTRISKRFKTSIYKLKKVNKLNTNIVYLGQVLKIPYGG